MAIRALILLTLFALPWYVVRFTVLGLPTTLLETVLIITLSVWALQKAKHIYKSPQTARLQIPRSYYMQTREEWGYLWWPSLFFLVASIIALMNAPQFVPALGHWRAFILEPILFALILLDTIKTERDHSLVLYALAASLAIPVAIALYQQITGQLIPNEFWASLSTRRVTSIYGYPNALGLYAVPVLILIIPHIIKQKSLKVAKSVHSLLFIATVAALMFTRSKGALLALAVGLAVFFLLLAKRKVLVAGALVVIAAIGIFVFKDSFNLRGISTVQGGDSISVRLTQYRETWEMLKDHPFTGAGLRGYQTAMAPYHAQKYIEVFMYPHNIFLTMWSELGLLGLIAFMWILIVYFKQQFNNLTIYHTTIAAMSALLAHGLVDVPYFKNDLAMLFWILLALAIPITQQHRQQLKNMLQ